MFLYCLSSKKHLILNAKRNLIFWWLKQNCFGRRQGVWKISWKFSWLKLWAYRAPINWVLRPFLGLMILFLGAFLGNQRYCIKHGKRAFLSIHLMSLIYQYHGSIIVRANKGQARVLYYSGFFIFAKINKNRLVWMNVGPL